MGKIRLVAGHSFFEYQIDGGTWEYNYLFQIGGEHFIGEYQIGGGNFIVEYHIGGGYLTLMGSIK